MNKLEIYTDGSCDPNPGFGGWAFVVILNEKVVMKKTGYEPNTTNNRMEYIAAIEAISTCSSTFFEYQDVTIYSDSQLLVNTYNKWVDKWMKSKKKLETKKNLDLVKLLFEHKQKHPKIKVQWVRGHNGNKWNEFVDELANDMALGCKQIFG